jgi:hypothetical protein
MSAARAASTPTTNSVRPNLVTREVVKHTVVSDIDVFRAFTGSMHNALTDHVETRGLRMNVSLDELFKYYLTAVRARTYRANRQYESHDPTFHIKCNSAWCLPATFASIVDKLGVVELDVPRATFVPVWPSELNELTYSEPAELVPTTQKLASLSDHPDLRLTFVTALQNNVTGDAEVMTLIPLRDTEGRIRQVRGRMPFDGVSAVTVYALQMVHGFYDAMEPRILERVMNMENPYRIYAEELAELFIQVAWKVA